MQLAKSVVVQDIATLATCQEMNVYFLAAALALCDDRRGLEGLSEAVGKSVICNEVGTADAQDSELFFNARSAGGRLSAKLTCSHMQLDRVLRLHAKHQDSSGDMCEDMSSRFPRDLARICVRERCTRTFVCLLTS